VADTLSKVVKIDGKDYVFELTRAVHKRVKTMTEVSLPDLVSDISGERNQEERLKALDEFYKLTRNFDKFAAVVRAMILPQLEKNNIDENKFDELFDSEVAFACGEAVTQSLIDFFLQQKDARGDLLRTSVQMARRAMKIDKQWMDRTVVEMDRRLNEMEQTIAGPKGQDAAAKAIQKTLTNSSTTLPESLASILTPSP